MTHHKRRMEELKTPAPAAPTQKLLFLYTPEAQIDAADLAALQMAGFMPIKVGSFDAVKIMDPLTMADNSSAIYAAAMETLLKQDGRFSETANARTLFGKILLGKLVASPPPSGDSAHG
jgi:hypothetical protein